MVDTLKSRVEDSLAGCMVPNTQQPLMAVSRLMACELKGDSLHVKLDLGFSLEQTARAALVLTLQDSLQKAGLSESVQVELSANIRSHGQASSHKAVPGVRNVVAVASGKGGVGKSTTSVNIACALAQQGCRVGLLDADIYGPNQPLMLGVTAVAKADDSQLVPLLAHGVYSMSMGYLVDPDTPMVWRGPMVSKALTQLLYQTAWPDLDYLIVDLPPGTGDVQLTLSSSVRMTGAVIVSTPQDVALLDAKKAIKMFSKVSVPVLGMVENMSLHVCSQCGHEEAIFGHGGALSVAKDFTIPLLGELPLSLSVRQACDQGTPIVCADAESDIAQRYQSIATNVSLQVALQPINYDSHFKVAVETTGSTQGE